MGANLAGTCLVIFCRMVCAGYLQAPRVEQRRSNHKLVEAAILALIATLYVIPSVCSDTFYQENE